MNKYCALAAPHPMKPNLLLLLRESKASNKSPALRPQRGARRLRLGLEKNHTGVGVGWGWGKRRCFFVGAGGCGVFRFCNPGHAKRKYTGTGESNGLGYVLLFRA